MGGFLDSIRIKAGLPQKTIDDTGICQTCGNLCAVTETLIGCEAHDKLIIPEFPPHANPKFKCGDWKPNKSKEEINND